MDSKNSIIHISVSDCQAILIPTGIKVIIPKGTEIKVQQHLGDTYTVYANGNLYRIEGKYAIAIGLKQEETPESNILHSDLSGPITVDIILEKLKSCYDPEIPVNIVDLGLIYRCEIKSFAEATGFFKVEIDMTLTAPGCGMGPILVEDVRNKISSLATISEVEVQLVFDPPWTVDRMTDLAKLELGMF